MCDTDVTAVLVVPRQTRFLVAASPPKAATDVIVPPDTRRRPRRRVPTGQEGEIGAEDGRTVVPV
jgi:hypothetical protein